MTFSCYNPACTQEPFEILEVAPYDEKFKPYFGGTLTSDGQVTSILGVTKPLPDDWVAMRYLCIECNQENVWRDD